MAASTVTLTKAAYPNGEDTTNRHLIVFGTAAYAASPATYTTGGIAVNWLQAGPLNTTATKPVWAEFQSVSGSGYLYVFNLASNTLQIFTGAAAQSPATELTSGAAIPAAVSADVIAFRAEFNKNV